MVSAVEQLAEQLSRLPEEVWTQLDHRRSEAAPLDPDAQTQGIPAATAATAGSP